MNYKQALYRESSSSHPNLGIQHSHSHSLHIVSNNMVFVTQSQREILQTVTIGPSPSRLRCACCFSHIRSALRVNNSDSFRGWLSGGIQDLGSTAVEVLMHEWMNPLITIEEMDRMVG